MDIVQEAYKGGITRETKEVKMMYMYSACNFLYFFYFHKYRS